MTDQAAPIVKAPAARRDYGWDWAQWLTNGESLTGVTATGVNVTVESASIVGTQTVAWVTGGVPGRAGVVFNVTTSAGRADQRTLKLWVRER